MDWIREMGIEDRRRETEDRSPVPGTRSVFTTVPGHFKRHNEDCFTANVYSFKRIK